MTMPMDEIAAIAQDYHARHGTHAAIRVDDEISRAIGQNMWSDVLKWHRVRHRLRRLQMVQSAMPASGAIN